MNEIKEWRRRRRIKKNSLILRIFHSALKLDLGTLIKESTFQSISQKLVKSLAENFTLWCNGKFSEICKFADGEKSKVINGERKFMKKAWQEVSTEVKIFLT